MNERTELEKAVDAVYQLATLVHVYYVSLLESGFSADEALRLTLAYQTEFIRMAKSKGQE